MRLRADGGTALAAAHIEPEPARAVALGEPFGIDGRELFPSAILASGSTLRVVALGCDDGSELDACADPTVELFERRGSDWTHRATVDTGDFDIASWARVSAAAVGESEVIVAISNIETGDGASTGSTTISVDDQGRSTTLATFDDPTDQTCADESGALVLRRSRGGDGAEVVALTGEQPAAQQLEGTDWSMSCDPALVWSSTSARLASTGEPVELPAGTVPVRAADGVVVATPADGDSSRITLVRAETGEVLAEHDLGRPFGPVSMTVDASGTLVAADVAPPDEEHLPVWIRAAEARTAG